MLSDSALPYPTPTDSAPTAAAHLRALAELAAAAGLPAGHTVQLNTNLVAWTDAARGQDVKFAAPGAGGMMAAFWRHEVAGVPGSGGRVHVTAAASSPQMTGPLWPAALAASARSFGPDLRVVLRGQEAPGH